MKNAFLIIGEGPTEYYFLYSLKDDYRILQNLRPEYPKNTSLHQLECAIKDGIKRGYSNIYCLIDMDNKKGGNEKNKYLTLKKKYHNKRITKQNQGLNCLIKFFETDRCTELFFLYYFKYTTKLYDSSDEIVYDLHNQSGYEKKKSFFQKHPLHPFFVTQGGSLKAAISNSVKSMEEANLRGNTYSELGALFQELGIE